VTSSFGRLDHSLRPAHAERGLSVREPGRQKLWAFATAPTISRSPRTLTVRIQRRRQGQFGFRVQLFFTERTSRAIRYGLSFRRAQRTVSHVVITGVGTLGTEVTHPRMFDNKPLRIDRQCQPYQGRHSIRFGVDATSLLPARSAKHSWPADMISSHWLTSMPEDCR